MKPFIWVVYFGPLTTIGLILKFLKVLSLRERVKKSTWLSCDNSKHDEAFFRKIY